MIVTVVQEEGVLGKLRIRVSTLQPWTQVEARLPLLADREKRGVKVAHAHLSLKVPHPPSFPPHPSVWTPMPLQLCNQSFRNSGV